MFVYKGYKNLTLLLNFFVGIGVEVDDDSQPEEGGEDAEEADNLVIEVPDRASPGSPQQLPDAPSRSSSQGSRPSTAGKQREEERAPGNQLLMMPWGQTEMQVNIGIDEVGIVVYYTSVSDIRARSICLICPARLDRSVRERN